MKVILCSLLIVGLMLLLVAGIDKSTNCTYYVGAAIHSLAYALLTFNNGSYRQVCCSSRVQKQSTTILVFIVLSSS